MEIGEKGFAPFNDEYVGRSIYLGQFDSGCPSPQGAAPPIQASKSAILLICLWFVSFLKKK
jgi:hypothetical protein